MGKIIMMTSFKGGVGKSTIAVNISVGLVARGYKVLLTDMDCASASADLMLGMSPKSVYTADDAVSGRATIKDSIVTGGELRPDLLCAPLTFKKPDHTRFIEFLNKSVAQYDFTIFDCPPGHFDFFAPLATLADCVYAVTLHTAASIRSIERLSYFLSENNTKNPRLIINCFDGLGVKNGKKPGICDIIEESRIRLAGIIEHDVKIARISEFGLTVYDKSKAPSVRTIQNFDGIIDRLLNKNAVLKKKYDGISAKKLYFNKRYRVNR